MYVTKMIWFSERLVLAKSADLNVGVTPQTVRSIQPVLEIFSTQRHGTQYSAFEANRTRFHKTSYEYTHFLNFSVGQHDVDLGFFLVRFPRSD